MERLKFALFSIIVLVAMGAALYWALGTIQSGSENKTSEMVSQLEEENRELSKQVEDLKSELRLYKPEAVNGQPKEEPTLEPEESAPTTVYKHQTLINEMEKLVADKVYMKLKSNGSRVGTVQRFLNIYNNTTSQVDNDYGAGTQKAVAAFQKAEGLQSDGEAGVNTFNKMISWLKEQG